MIISTNYLDLAQTYDSTNCRFRVNLQIKIVMSKTPENLALESRYL